jgi:hypothetical protein
MYPTHLATASKSIRYVARNVGYFVRDPEFFWMKTVARFERVRSFRARRGERLEPLAAAAPSTDVFEPAFSLPEAISTLRDEGYFVGLTLRPSVVEALVGRARGAICYADRDPNCPLRPSEHGADWAGIDSKLKIASYFEQQEAWPEFQAVRADPWLNALARAYLGCEPVYLRSELAWSFPRRAPTRAERVAAAQVFHCDINDYRTLKFFFYLTDVGLGDGPHAYVKNQPRRRLMRHQVLGQRCSAIDEAALLATYGDNEVVTICGRAGTGFAGDPYYFHRGTTPTAHPRLLMQIEMGCRSYRTWY